jgi:hypothetical protein
MPAYVIAVCGGSCSGKTTIASSLAEELNKLPVSAAPAPSAMVPSISAASNGSVTSTSGLTRQTRAHPDPTDATPQNNSSCIRADGFFHFDQYLTDSCPNVERNGHIWKDWESVDAMHWENFVDAIMKAKHHPDSPKYIVVEGFLALAKPETRSLFDAAIDFRLTKEECWKRRKARAREMAVHPPGFSNRDEQRNYEVLETYVKSHAVHLAFRDAAAIYEAEDGELAWLRMYFEEMIWPAAIQQNEEIQKAESQLPVLHVDATDPPGNENWKEYHFPKCLEFVIKHLKAP